jgi:glutamate synthase (NADPH/NADH) small chain
MAASLYEQELAANAGVRILSNAAPVAATATGMTFAYSDADGAPGAERFELAADAVLTAIGQTLGPVPETLAVEGGKIAVTGPGRTSLPRVWAGGDCASGGDDLTVTAVAEGRDAAMDIHAALTAL